MARVVMSVAVGSIDHVSELVGLVYSRVDVDVDVDVDADADADGDLREVRLDSHARRCG